MKNKLYLEDTVLRLDKLDKDARSRVTRFMQTYFDKPNPRILVEITNTLDKALSKIDPDTGKPFKDKTLTTINYDSRTGKFFLALKYKGSQDDCIEVECKGIKFKHIRKMFVGLIKALGSKIKTKPGIYQPSEKRFRLRRVSTKHHT